MVEAMHAQGRDKRGSIPPYTPASPQPHPNAEPVGAHARALAAGLVWLPNVPSSKTFATRCRQLAPRLATALRTARSVNDHGSSTEILRENATLIENCFNEVYDALHSLRTIPHVRTSEGAIVPRVLAIAEDCLRANSYRCDESAFTTYVDAFQQVTALTLRELWALIAVVKLVLLERLVEDSLSAGYSGEKPQRESATCVSSLSTMNRIPWRRVIEPLIGFDQFLRQDPVGAYNQMEPETRALYRREVAQIAQYSDLTELEVAQTALALAQKAQRTKHPDPRIASRLSHVGYYLVAEGAEELKQEAGFWPPRRERVHSFITSYADWLFLPAIGLLTVLLAETVVQFSGFDFSSFKSFLFLLLVLLIPCSEAAVQIVRYAVVSLLTPRILPKLDFSRGIPDSCATLVAVPTLLLDESQVRKLVADMEVRFLGNRDRNLHFALLTDLPDSTEPPKESEPLVNLCAELIAQLNEKYEDHDSGSFFLLHRTQRYNRREGAWIGWERKRGKLLQLNCFLKGEGDEYCKKVGNLPVLSTIRFVIPLDADTLLPRGTARRMIGTLAHPLNQAIIDPQLNITVAGYGILQPRVDIGVQSAARSRLAKMFSGQTGLDIYARAVSDVYQDLYGEGSYVGKGIYEMDVLHRLLDGRFPSNLLLSHDLIEGAYARSGLVTDIEVIEDYPTLYSAYNRRKHRWLRGDWQIAEWLLPAVPTSNGKRVANPISLVSKWKIFDNLRRSLVEPAIFLLLVLGWFVLPGTAAYWTLVAVGLLFLPLAVKLLLQVIHSLVQHKPLLQGATQNGLATATVGVVLTLTFLAHQMLLSIDAVVRALVRRVVTGERLLEWVTAAEAEHGPSRRTQLDLYLDWTPALAVGIGVLLWWVRGRAVWVALPILLLWASSTFVSVWLSRPPNKQLSMVQRDRILLRRVGLRTWRFFAEFSNAGNGHLVPDHVRECPFVVDERVSPTNIGFLLNSRQVAWQLGYLTLPEFIELTQATLHTLAKLPRYRGHFYNWYDATSCEPLRPLVVSSVDSGNLVASLWTLEQGALEQLRQPLVGSQLCEGVADYLRELIAAGRLPGKTLRQLVRAQGTDWLEAIGKLSSDSLRSSLTSKPVPDSQWQLDQLLLLVESIGAMLHRYTPWLLPRFGSLAGELPDLGFGPWRDVPLEQAPQFCDALQYHLASLSASPLDEQKDLYEELRQLLPEARALAAKLVRDLRKIARQAAEFADQTDFTFLLNRERNLLAVMFDVERQRLGGACYDQLASESRLAAFIAIAKDDIPQATWFALTRYHKLEGAHIVLLSWSGTMFEYLMPCLWMHTYPGTLLDRAGIEAVRAQHLHAARKGVPWGISESASSEKLDDGSYKYFAFGLPQLALSDSHPNALVISPYSTFLASHVSPGQMLSNVRKLQHLGLLGDYGMYESADFSGRKNGWRAQPEIVRSWMAHHQGMILLAIANTLQDGIIRHWFHDHPSVRATELLLQERPVSHINLQSRKHRLAA
jgi:cyclic beta-1,2-glucan glucanotransferase